MKLHIHSTSQTIPRVDVMILKIYFWVHFNMETAQGLKKGKARVKTVYKATLFDIKR